MVDKFDIDFSVAFMHLALIALDFVSTFEISATVLCLTGTEDAFLDPAHDIALVFTSFVHILKLVTCG